MLGVLRTLVREAAVLGAGLLLLAAGLFAYREWVAGHGSAPPLPDIIAATLRDLDALDRRWLLGGLGFAVMLALWLALRLITTGGKRRGPWLLAFGVLSACGAAIVGLYYAPDEIRITETLRLRRLPREEFLASLAWGAAVIGGGHLVLFLLLSLLGRTNPRGKARRDPGQGR